MNTFFEILIKIAIIFKAKMCKKSQNVLYKDIHSEKISKDFFCFITFE